MSWSRRVPWLFLLIAGSLGGLPARAEPKVSGMVFADAHVALQGASVPADSSAFRFRRVQLTVDQALDSVFSVRVQLEGDDGNLGSADRQSPFLKQVWLRWSGPAAFGDVTMGLSVTPLWSVSESFWGYRSIEKTVLDVQGFGSVVETGVALQRTAPRSGGLGYHLMVANGSGLRPENNGSKKLMLSVPWRAGDMVLEGVADYEGQPGPLDRWTAKLFGGWMHEGSAFGVEAYRRVHENAGPLGADLVPMGVSVFGHAPLSPRWTAVGRVDWTDPDSEQDATGYRVWYVIAALDYAARGNVHFLPNVLVRAYAPKASTVADRDADVTLRGTLFFTFR